MTGLKSDSTCLFVLHAEICIQLSPDTVYKYCGRTWRSTYTSRQTAPLSLPAGDHAIPMYLQPYNEVSAHRRSKPHLFTYYALHNTYTKAPGFIFSAFCVF